MAWKTAGRVAGWIPAAAYTAPRTWGDGQPVVVELEAHLLALADELVAAAVEAHHVGLEPVPEPGLGDAAVGLQVVEQVHQLVLQLAGDVVDVPGDDAAEEDAAEPGRGVRRKPLVAERDPASGDHRPGVTDLELGEQHGEKVDGAVSPNRRWICCAGDAVPPPVQKGSVPSPSDSR